MLVRLALCLADYDDGARASRREQDCQHVDGAGRRAPTDTLYAFYARTHGCGNTHTQHAVPSPQHSDVKEYD